LASTKSPPASAKGEWDRLASLNHPNIAAIYGSVAKGPFMEDFDVSPDGSRFLVVEADDSDSTLVVIPNWITELRRVTAVVR
jgi:hypothetical protein